jgi:hypothetical protein
MHWKLSRRLPTPEVGNNVFLAVLLTEALGGSVLTDELVLLCFSLILRIHYGCGSHLPFCSMVPDVQRPEDEGDSSPFSDEVKNAMGTGPTRHTSFWCLVKSCTGAAVSLSTLLSLVAWRIRTRRLDGNNSFIFYPRKAVSFMADAEVE